LWPDASNTTGTYTLNARIQGILGHMVKLFRMYRLTRIVEKQTKHKYKHPSGDPYEYKKPTELEVSEKFRVFSFNTGVREYVFSKTLEATIANHYVVKDIRGSAAGYYYLSVDPDKGERLIEGRWWGISESY